MTTALVSSPAVQIQRYARAVGVLVAISVVAGILGEYLIPTGIIDFADPDATTRAIVGPGSLFRIGFAAYLVEAVCDVSLTYALFVLLRPVDPPLAMLAVLFRMLATALFAVCELFYFSALSILSGAPYLGAFSSEQLQSLAMLALRIYANSGIFSVFYGIGAVVVGWLIARSGYLPRLVGIVFAVSGALFVLQCFLLVVSPSLSVRALVAPAAGIAAIALGGWCLVRGVDVATFEARAARVG